MPDATRDNAVLGFLPIRITAAIVPSSRGHRRRQKEAARGSSFPERAPLCPRDYELASISWMEHPSSSPPLPRIMGGWCTHYCDVVATIRFRNRVPYRDARERAFLVRRRRRQKFSSGYNTGLLFDESRWFIAWFAMCTFFFSSFVLVERGGMLGGWLFTRLLSGYGVPFKAGRSGENGG